MLQCPVTSSGITLLRQKKGIGGGDSVFSCPITLKALPYLPSSSSCDSGKAGVSGGVRQSQTGRMFLSFSFRKHPLGFSLFSLHSCLLIHECINMDLSFLVFCPFQIKDESWDSASQRWIYYLFPGRDMGFCDERICAIDSVLVSP